MMMRMIMLLFFVVFLFLIFVHTYIATEHTIAVKLIECMPKRNKYKYKEHN